MIIQCCISTKEIPIERVKFILIELNLLLLFFFFLFRRNIFIHQGVQMFLLFAIAILKKKDVLMFHIKSPLCRE